MAESDQQEQERVDRFYELVRSGEWDRLVGRTTREIHDRFGDPAEVWALDHGGHHWTRIVYRFRHPPSHANEQEREAIRKGMKFSPSLLFRDGIAVSERELDDAISGGGLLTAGPPAGIEWRQGGAFP